MKEVTLPSGAILKIGSIPFEVSNNLRKVVMRELQGIPIQAEKQMMDLCKDYLCLSFGSDPVEAALWKCLERCTYNGGMGDLKIDKNTFESKDAREDYIDVQLEVALECLRPFSKGLYAALQRMLALSSVGIPK